MTTYVFVDGLLAADTRISRDRSDGTTFEIGRMNKISVNPLFAWVGAGRTRVIFFLSLLPNLLALRWLGWALVPNQAAYANGEHNALYVVWRNGMVWSIDVTLERRWGFLLARRTNLFVADSRADKVLSKNGSGSAAFTIDELKDLGAELAILKAAAFDTATSPQPIVFDTRKWCYTLPVPRFPPVDGTLARAFSLWAAWFFALPPKPSFLADVLAPWADMARWAWRKAGRMLS